MAIAIIRLAPKKLLGEFLVRKEHPQNIALGNIGQYKTMSWVNFPGLSGAAAAEEAFNLTNDPSRESECEARYGLYRSIAVGDIVRVEGVDYLCSLTGWIELPTRR